MSLSQWTAVDDYIQQLFVQSDRALDETLKSITAEELPPINVSPTQAKMLYLLARLCNAGKILEIGTLAGYSTIWLARALPQGGKLITLEYEAKHARVAQENIKRAGLSDSIEIRIGAALDTLPVLEKEGHGPFDMIFIDADKESYPAYLEWSLKLSRPGTLIIADNVVRDGEVLNPKSEDSRVHGVRQFNERMASDQRLNATIVQTVGCKGYDGFTMAIVDSL